LHLFVLMNWKTLCQNHTLDKPIDAASYLIPGILG
jgi:hypothetical protein